MTEIVLVRHGQASFGKANYDKLSDLGAKQAVWLGEFLAHNNIEFDALWRGDMFRHEETANGILDGLNKHLTEDVEKQSLHARLTEQIAIHKGLNEFDFQAVADAYIKIDPASQPAKGAPPAEFYRLLRKSMLAWSAGKLDEFELPELWSEFQGRVMNVLDAAVDSGHKRVVLSTSGGAIAMMVSQVLGADAATMVNLNLQIRNTSITQIFANKSGTHLHQFNAIPHLEHPDRRTSISYS